MSKETLINELHRKWLSRAKTAVINGEEMTVLPYGYLTGVCIEAIDQTREETIRENKEIVICSAIKVNRVDDYLIIRGHRHCDCYHNLSLRPKTGIKYIQEEGFITSLNRFVGREEARQLQDKAGIQSADRDGYRGKFLYSEDLY